MVTLTVTIPDDLHARLLDQSRKLGSDVNDVIVAGLEEVVSDLPDTASAGPPEGDRRAPLLSHEELQERFAHLDASRCVLSTAVLEDREDRT